DRVLAVTQLMRQAHLPTLGMTLLRAVEIGYPDRRPVPIKHLGDHTGATAGTDHVNDDVVVLEHPVPVGPSGNTDRGLIRADHAGAAQPGENAGDIGIEAWLAAAERRVQGALADAQAIQVQQQPAEPPVT